MLNSMSMNHKSGSDYLESFSQLSEKVNNIDKQMTNSFVMDDYWNETNQVGISEVNSSDGELKALIRELIRTIKEGDMTIAEAIDDIEMNPDINVYTDLEGEVVAQIYAYDEKMKERDKRVAKPSLSL